MYDGVKKCYLIEEDDAALKCIKKELAASKESCKPRLVLLVQKNCDSCAEQKKRYQGDINSGIISVVDVASPEGLDIARQNNLGATPYLLILDCNNKMIE